MDTPKAASGLKERGRSASSKKSPSKITTTRTGEHCRWTPQVGKDLARAVEFAPLHVPVALRVLKAAQHNEPALPQIICLDTAFHRTLPDVSSTLPLPADLRGAGIQRYGFHGISLESIVAQLPEPPSRLVVAHLGNGSSVTAIRKGHSQATTMALTPNAGMLMGTRCGDMDPGVVTWLMRHHGVNADEIDDVLNRKSGLLGVSGLSSDARELLTARASNRGADLALRMFALTAAQAIAAMGCVLGGVDLLVFTGGIGEHASDVRDAILHHLDWLPPLRTQTLPSREDLQIAAITIDLARQPST